MSKTISVREAAAALGITPRAVTYRLEKGQLKGILNKNDNGVPEWRIYPNKEILAGINRTEDVALGPINFDPSDVVEAETVGQTTESGAASEPVVSTDFQLIIEQCVRPLVEEVKAQALALAEKDRIIEEQQRQLRLLPDLQKRAEEEKKRAESERQQAELKALELEALSKQIIAMEEQKVDLEAKASQAVGLSSDLEQLKAKVAELEKPKSWWKRLLG